MRDCAAPPSRTAASSLSPWMHARLCRSPLVRRQRQRPCAGRPAATSANSPVVRVQRSAGRDPRADHWSVVYMECKSWWRSKVRSCLSEHEASTCPKRASHSWIQSYTQQGLESIHRTIAQPLTLVLALVW